MSDASAIRVPLHGPTKALARLGALSARVMDRSRLERLTGWFVVGIVAVAGELALLGLLVEGGRLPLWLASALAAEGMMMARFLVTDRVVFGHRRPAFGRLGRYHLACAGAFAVSWCVLNVVAVPLGLPYALAWAVGTAAALGWSALSNLRWVWRLAPDTK